MGSIQRVRDSLRRYYDVIDASQDDGPESSQSSNLLGLRRKHQTDLNRRMNLHESCDMDSISPTQLIISLD